MKKGDCVFVYGTLRKGERADLSRSAKNFSVEYLGDDFVNGKLYHMGAYPGFKILKDTDTSVFEGSLPIVAGEAFYVRDSSVGALLDAYEGYPHLFDRLELPTKHGRIVWVYVYQHMTIEDQFIETGDWKNPRLSLTHRIPMFK